MTLVTAAAEGDEPGVHALLIGVGRYPHLKDGDGERFAFHSGMGQLSSPHHSVVALRDWLRNDLSLPGSPLRSLRILSSTPEAHVENPYDVPTMDAIRAETKAWLKDCDKHADNLALFYFCGHGLEFGNVTALLAQNFGEEPDSPLIHAFDPGLLADAVLAKSASKQLFLIDACRGSPAAMTEHYRHLVPGLLIHPTQHENSRTTKQSELRATEVGGDAFGIPGGPSIFMKSLLASMKGASSLQRTPTTWVVSTSSMRTGVDWLVRREYGDVKQRVVGGGLSHDFDFHQVNGNPIVPVTVSTEPVGRISQMHLSTDCGKSRPIPTNRPWAVDVGMGTRTFYAGDSANPQLHSKVESVAPPYRLVAIPCGNDE